MSPSASNFALTFVWVLYLSLLLFFSLFFLIKEWIYGSLNISSEVLSPCTDPMQACNWVMFSLTYQLGAVAWGESSSYDTTLHEVWRERKRQADPPTRTLLYNLLYSPGKKQRPSDLKLHHLLSIKHLLVGLKGGCKNFIVSSFMDDSSCTWLKFMSVTAWKHPQKPLKLVYCSLDHK